MTNFLNFLLNKGIKIAIILGVSVGVYYIGKLGIKKVINRKTKGKTSSQILSLMTIMSSVWKYIIILFSCTGILNVFDMGITANSLLAAAGVGGVALGIGAQDFVKDIVNGFTIILEEQLAVGDRVDIDGKTGIVSDITLRTTHVIGIQNEEYMIPNSYIRLVTNYSKNDPIVIVPIYIQEQQKIKKAIEAIRFSCENFKSKNTKHIPYIKGIYRLEARGAKLNICCKGEMNKFFELEYDLNSFVCDILNENEIDFISKVAIIGKED